jgi:SAM-dependent methyltransferase
VPYRAAVIDDSSVVAVEREMASYYDAEEGREGRPLDPRRVAARGQFVDGVRARSPEGPTLEIGTGPGRDALALIEAGLTVIGVDLSLGHASRAVSRGVTMTVASARALPLATGSIGALWSMSTLMHIPAVAIEDALREIARVLAPGATVAIGVYGGADTEQFSDVDPGSGARRLFSGRSEGRWRSLLEILGRIDDLQRWADPGADDDALRYYLAFVTAHQ